MPISKSLYFAPKKFGAGELALGLRAIVSQAVGDSLKPEFIVYRILDDGSRETARHVDHPELDRICDLAVAETVIRVVTERGLSGIWFQMSGTDEEITIQVEAENARQLQGVVGLFGPALGLKPSSTASADSINTRVARLEREVRQLSSAYAEPRLRCFLSTRFNAESETYMLRVQRYLTLLGVDVVSGNSYEPRRISEKVADRLTSRIDFFVVIVAASGESAWTRDEIGVARSSSVPVVPLVETTAAFEPGLYGDLEYIGFAPSHIGDAFIGLLEAVRYLEAARPSASLLSSK